eukprot:Selendium_serpulae@DN4346_c0_g1_i10.p1
MVRFTSQSSFPVSAHQRLTGIAQQSPNHVADFPNVQTSSFPSETCQQTPVGFLPAQAGLENISAAEQPSTDVEGDCMSTASWCRLLKVDVVGRVPQAIAYLTSQEMDNLLRICVQVSAKESRGSKLDESYFAIKGDVDRLRSEQGRCQKTIIEAENKIMRVLLGFCTLYRAKYAQGLHEVVGALARLKPFPSLGELFCLFEEFILVAAPHLVREKAAPGVKDASTDEMEPQKRICCQFRLLLQFHSPRVSSMVDRAFSTPFWNYDWFDALGCHRFKDVRLWLWLWHKLLVLQWQRCREAALICEHHGTPGSLEVATGRRQTLFEWIFFLLCYLEARKRRIELVGAESLVTADICFDDGFEESRTSSLQISNRDQQDLIAGRGFLAHVVKQMKDFYVATPRAMLQAVGEIVEEFMVQYRPPLSRLGFKADPSPLTKQMLRAHNWNETLQHAQTTLIMNMTEAALPHVALSPSAWRGRTHGITRPGQMVLGGHKRELDGQRMLRRQSKHFLKCDFCVNLPFDDVINTQLSRTLWDPWGFQQRGERTKARPIVFFIDLRSMQPPMLERGVGNEHGESQNVAKKVAKKKKKKKKKKVLCVDT